MKSYTISRRTMRLLLKETTLEGSEIDISRGKALLKLANDLFEEFQRCSDPSLLELAIKHNMNSLNMLPEDHADYFLICHQLAACLWRRSQVISSSNEDLEMAIYYGVQSMIHCPSDHPKQVHVFHILGSVLVLRFQRNGDPRDLQFSLMYYREYFMQHPVEHPGATIILSALATSLLESYRNYGDRDALDTCIKYYLQALSKNTADHLRHLPNLFNLVVAFLARFESYGKVIRLDLDAACTYADEALRSCPRTHFLRPHILGCFSESLLARFTYFGDPADLDLYFKYGFENLSLLPSGHPERPRVLIDMAEHFLLRYQSFGALYEIDAAIQYAKEALALRPIGHPHREWCLSCLGSASLARYIENGTEADIEVAIQCSEERLAAYPPGHPHRRLCLTILAECLRSRFDQHGDITELQSAIAHLKEANDSKLVATGDFNASSELAITLLSRYYAMNNIDDFELAFDHLRKAQEHIPFGHPYLLVIYKFLAAVHVIKHSLDQESSTQDQALYYFEKAVSHVAGGLKSRLDTSLEWIGYAHTQHHPSELNAYHASLTLLDQYFMVTPHISLRHEIHRRKIPRTLAADAASCAIVAGHLELAVELLEYGRALLWTQLTRIRMPLDALRDRDQNGRRLAEEFASVSRQLEMSNISPTTQSNNARSESAGTYPALARQWDVVVEEIRKVDGFSDFLSPAPFKDLQIAAAEGPVVIPIVGCFRSDTLIIWKDGPPRLVPLKLQIEEVHKMSSEFQNIFRMFTGRGEEKRRGSHLIPLLRKLWDCAVCPVVCELAGLVPRGSRIWWCPTSTLGGLPLHAAGPYCRGKFNLIDIYISSYTPTLSTLIRARREQARPRSFLAIGQPKPYEGFGQGLLQTVEEELNIIEGLCPPSMTFSRLYGPDATFDAAVDGLRKHNWIHLACHGQQDADNPYESCFAMGDKPLRLLDVMQAQLDDSHFAFLSACHTAVGDFSTPDEVIHLAAGLQFSGFRSVIGTIGAVDDGVVVEVVKEFYKNIFAEGGRCTDAARALSKTMISGRKRLPLDQRVIFIHIGA